MYEKTYYVVVSQDMNTSSSGIVSDTNVDLNISLLSE